MFREYALARAQTEQSKLMTTSLRFLLSLRLIKGEFANERQIPELTSNFHPTDSDYLLVGPWPPVWRKSRRPCVSPGARNAIMQEGYLSWPQGRRLQ